MIATEVYKSFYQFLKIFSHNRKQLMENITLYLNFAFKTSMTEIDLTKDLAVLENVISFIIRNHYFVEIFHNKLNISVKLLG